jgi:lysophospholipase L1-like esterase
MRWMTRLGLGLAVAAALLAVGEGVGRLVEPGLVPPEPTLPVPGPGRQPALESAAEAARAGIPLLPGEDAGWRLPVDDVRHLGGVVYRTNALGLRGPEVPPDDGTEWRVLSLGDSSVWGWGVPEEATFVGVLAKRLATPERPVRGVIGGVPGHESAQALRTLREVGPAVAPDVVIIGTLWSDVFLDEGERRDDRVARATAEVQGPLRGLAMYRLLRRALAPWLRARSVAWLDTREDLEALPDADARSLGGYLANLRGLVAESRALGARPVLLVLPCPADLEAAPLPDAIADYRAAMVRVGTETETPVVDGPRFFGERGAGIGHFYDQVHPASPGHALLAEALVGVAGPG